MVSLGTGAGPGREGKTSTHLPVVPARDILRHDGRLLTLEDTMEYFNLISSPWLNENEKNASLPFCASGKAADLIQ
jgi:hypothetical protein